MSMDQTQSNEGTRFAVTVAVVVFAFIVAFAAAWMLIGRPGSGSESNGSSEEGYVEYQEKTKEEVLVEIEQRTEVILDEEDAARKRQILESIER